MRRLLVLALAGLLLCSCVPASPDADTYDDKAALTLGAAVSETRTVQRLLETLHAGRMLRPTAVAQMRSSESALGTTTKAFTELNQPPVRDRLASRTSSLLDRAASLMSDARISIERKHQGQYLAIASDLSKLASTMEKLEGRVR